MKNWSDVKTQAKLDPALVEVAQTELDERIRSYKLAELRKKRELTQTQVAAIMGVQQPWVSQIEHGNLSHVEIDTLRSYITALGGRLRITAEFGDDQLLISK